MSAKISQMEALGILVTLWLWGLHNAEPTGKIPDVGRMDIAAAIPASMVSKGVDCKSVVDALITSGWIDEENGDLLFHDWDEWQDIWYAHLANKVKDAKRKRQEREAKREQENSPMDSPG